MSGPRYAFRLASFDEVARHPAAGYIPATRPPERSIEVPGLAIADTPDDLLVLHDAMIVPSAGVLWNGLWLGEAIHNLPANWRTVSWLPGTWDEPSASIVFRAEQLASTGVVEEPVMTIDTTVGAGNFGHFVHDTLPYALVLERARAVFPGLRFHITRPQFANAQRLFAAAFGQTVEAAIDLRGARLRRLVVARRQSVMGGQVWSMPFAGLRHARDTALRAWGLPGRPGALRVFLHRFQDTADRKARGLLYGRNFRNPDELLVGMLRAGFIALEPGRARIEEIADLLSRAECVASMHGAGLGNLIFCRPGARVVELRSHEGNWRSLEATSLVLGQNFGAIPQPVPQPGEEPWFDVDATVKALA
jgi:hypothetical protein